MATFRPGGTKFKFTSIPPSGTGVSVMIPAYLDNISDSYSATWGEHMDMGRGDPKFIYSQFGRTLSVSFKIVVLEGQKAYRWYEAINTLTEMTKPQYKSDIGFNGVFCQMEIGGLINEIGFIESVDVNIDNETPWVAPPDSDGHVPIVASVDVSFRVVGELKPNYKATGANGGLATKGFLTGNDGRDHIPMPPIEPIQPLKPAPFATNGPTTIKPPPSYKTQPQPPVLSPSRNIPPPQLPSKKLR